MSELTPPRIQTLGEEIANAVSHGLGLLLAVAALPILVFNAAQQGQAANVVGASLFAGTAIVLYLISTLYHALPAGRAKLLLNRLDHAAIYLFIAGSYMPFLLGVLRGPWGWALLSAVTAAAVVGVGAKLLNRLQHPLWSTGLYVAMGWMALVAAVPLVERMSPAGLGWLVAGGLSYTAGAVVFLLDSKLRYAHFVWHLFVLGGSTCHFFAALWHAHG
ncbi:hemolysin III family protein [Variovorax sp. J22G21]|uniref:PAQR family membrane homeostasis protein TrhA n=1 Tax=Variovorax fucosicus TaxID=3053517 RepID=UPI0025778396|nr:MULTISPECIES: hemolysin III family protein [unclassified Variovorax]MDM0038855.1 hemolysin III family protein [Variovorax sp. J22R193]MDM0055535.1 hemolysin III family protein [Variovorax sp. J22G47]MDM0063631.1 hemolysin III family protein [Variovorax sp. J22G21]